MTCNFIYMKKGGGLIIDECELEAYNDIFSFVFGLGCHYWCNESLSYVIKWNDFKDT
jgi:hypothetical protein